MKATKGSGLEQEQKSLIRAKVILGLITVALFCITYFGLFDTNLYYWHKQAGSFANIAGIVLFILCGAALLAGEWIVYKVASDTAWYIVWIVLFGLAIAASCGFNFSDPIK